METKEMTSKFDDLYGIMSSGDNVNNMELFGSVMREMFEWLTANKPELAQEWLSKLESIKWNNYLTSKEAAKIVSGMTPKPVWTKEQLMDTLQKLGLVTEETPYYNTNALYATMSMVYSDSAQTIANIIGKPLAEIGNETMVKAVYALALDKLKDVDGNYSVRYYFCL